jgi:hypothetical protein
MQRQVPNGALHPRVAERLNGLAILVVVGWNVTSKG